MKAKEAINLIESQIKEEGPWPLLVRLYKLEAMDRMRLRGQGKKLTQGLVASVADEMGEWIGLVSRGVNLEKANIKLLVASERANLFVKYGQTDPRASNQIDRMRAAVQRGQRPIDVLTQGGLEAIGGMMIGQMAQEARNHYKDRGLLCPHSVEARFCKHQETYLDPHKGLLSNIEDLTFVCTMVTLEMCDWKKEQEEV